MGQFKFLETPLSGVVVVEPQVWGDERGFFMETYSRRDFAAGGIDVNFVQENHSRSSRGVLRGMHFQSQQPQGKLIRVVAGSVYDVVVDLRSESATYGGCFGTILSAENKRQLYVPPRFAHGFLCLDDNTDFLYRCTDYYAPEFDSGIAWNDPNIGIDWRLAEFGLADSELLMSEKDLNQQSFIEFDTKC